jgi:hypothetical protein
MSSSKVTVAFLFSPFSPEKERKRLSVKFQSRVRLASDAAEVKQMLRPKSKASKLRVFVGPDPVVVSATTSFRTSGRLRASSIVCSTEHRRRVTPTHRLANRSSIDTLTQRTNDLQLNQRDKSVRFADINNRLSQSRQGSSQAD